MTNNTITGGVSFVKLREQFAEKNYEISLSYWLKEYQILSYLSNNCNLQNVIKLKDGWFGHHNNKQYIIFKFDKYKYNLSEYKIYTDNRLLQIMIDLTDSIKLLHSINIWHRDLKRSNIMINDDDRAVLIDFSHSQRFVRELNDIDCEITTLWYKAPELFKNTIYTEKIDIWSLGIIFIECITGSYLMGKITNGKEADVKQLLSNENIFIETVKKYYFENTRNFKHANRYWYIIKNMLNFNHKLRPSATDVYALLHRISVDLNISYIKPVNTYNKNEKIIKYNTELDEHSSIIHKYCKELMNTYTSIFSLTLTYEEISNNVDFLLSTNKITIDNCQYYVLILIYIYETLIYDKIMDLNELTQYTSTNINVMNELLTNLFSDSDSFLLHMFNTLDTNCKSVK